MWNSRDKLELPKCSYHVIYYNFEPIKLYSLPEGKTIKDLVDGDRVRIREEDANRCILRLPSYNISSKSKVRLAIQSLIKKCLRDHM